MWWVGKVFFFSKGLWQKSDLVGICSATVGVQKKMEVPSFFVGSKFCTSCICFIAGENKFS